MITLRPWALALLLLVPLGCKPGTIPSGTDPATDDADLDAPVVAKTLAPMPDPKAYRGHKDWKSINSLYSRMGAVVMQGYTLGWTPQYCSIILSKESGSSLPRLPDVPFPFDLALHGSRMEHTNLSNFTHLKELASLRISNMNVKGKRLAPLQVLPNLVAIEFHRCQLDADTYRTLATFPQFREIRDSISGHELDLKQLRRIPHLVTLNLESETISTDQLQTLVAHPGLRTLRLKHRIEDREARIGVLSQLTNLTELNLESTPPTTEEFKRLATLTKLERLELAGTREGLNGATFAALNQFPQLTHLRFTAYTLTDADILQMATLPRLEHLQIGGAEKLSDKILKDLTKHKSLKFLDVHNKKSDKAIKEFKAALPNCRLAGT